MKEIFIAAVVNTTRLTLYRPDGSSIVLVQGDERIAGILSPANTAAWARGQPVELELLPERDNHLAAFEKQAGDFKLFRVLKDKVKALFGAQEEPAEPMAPRVYGQVPGAPLGAIDPTKMDTAIQEILANADSVSAPGYQTQHTTDDDTIVAVTPAGQLVPGVEALEAHMAHAVATGNTTGVQAFISRLGKIIERRNFMVAELLNFCREGDLQFTDDGAILAYKVLKKKTGHPGVYVDCHTKQVPQKIGSFVCMDENLVDPSRRLECSNGLHIARRGYLRYFDGDACTLVRIEPEDVIAVPEGEPNKMRVRGYLILAEIPAADWSLLRNDRPVAGEETLRLLGQAISGKHVAKLEEVKITKHKGGGVQVRNLLGGLVSVPKITADPVAPVQALPTNEIKHDAPVVSPKVINQAVSESKANAKPKTATPAQPVVKSSQAKASPSTPGSKNLPTPNSEQDLSPNQKQALGLARKGELSMRKIATRTGLSDRAVARLLHKFGPGKV